MTDQSFDQLGLAEPILRALKTQSFITPTPIQQNAIPPLLAGHDLLGIAQTGTGKTAAFALPILHHLAATRVRMRPFGTRCLILAPTRELAVQIEEAVRLFGAGLGLRTALILGGVGRSPQVRRMSRGVDVVVGTPGRICDLISTNELLLGEVSHFVLDEADRMLDLGFIRDIRRVVALLPQRRQSMLFSATMPEEVGRLAATLLRDPVRVQIAAEEPVPERIDQFVHFVEAGGKRALLADMLRRPELERVIVFTRTKRGADRVAEHLEAEGFPAEPLHGNKSQNARQRSLDLFRRGQARVLVATDLAARGLDVTGVSHVINFELPNEPESYVHRIGRTARNGASGTAVSFCDSSEQSYLRAIERLTGVKLQVAGGTPPAFSNASPRKPQQPRDFVTRRPGPRGRQRPGARGQGGGSGVSARGGA